MTDDVVSDIKSPLPTTATILVKSNGTLGVFDNFTVLPPPPPPRTMLGQCAQSVPLEATLYGGEGGRPTLGKRAAFIIEQGEIMKTKQIFKVYHILFHNFTYKSVIHHCCCLFVCLLLFSTTPL